MVRPISATTLLLIMATFGVAVSQHAWADTEVTTCGQVYRGKGYLTADLDCSGYDNGHVITIDGGGELNLNGYTLTAPTVSPENIAILCTKSCKIYGNGGAVVGGTFGIWAENTVKVFDVSVTGPSIRGIRGLRTRVERVIVTNAGRDAITATGALTMRDSQVKNCGGVPDPVSGVIRKTSGVIVASRVRVSGSTVADNFWGGIEAATGARGLLRIEDSVVSGNGTNPDCGVVLTCNYDISATRLQVRGSLDCGRSFDFSQTVEPCDGDAPITATCDPTIHNFGICALD